MYLYDFRVLKRKTYNFQCKCYINAGPKPWISGKIRVHWKLEGGGTLFLRSDLRCDFLLMDVNEWMNYADEETCTPSIQNSPTRSHAAEEENRTRDRSKNYKWKLAFRIPENKSHWWHHLMDQSPINQNFELNKSRQKFHHSLKEHQKISNITKFRCKML